MIHILYKMGEKIVIILNIYRAMTIFLLFYDDQDTLSTKCEIEMSTSQLIFTNKNTPKAL